MCVHVRGSQRALNWSGGVVFSFLRRKGLEVIVFLLTSVVATIALVLVVGEWGGGMGWGRGGGGWEWGMGQGGGRGWAAGGRWSDEHGVSHGAIICCIWVLEAPELLTEHPSWSLGGGGAGPGNSITHAAHGRECACAGLLAFQLAIGVKCVQSVLSAEL